MSLPRSIRPDHKAISTRVAQGARVLDIGCGDGALLSLLKSARDADARGLEISPQDAGMAVARGLSVIQGDADSDLEVFPSNGFDVAILSKTVQEMRRPAYVLSELARIAPEVIISFRNYGRWSRRLSLLLTGRMPGRREWHDEGALHPSTCADMLDLANAQGLALVAAASMQDGRVSAFRARGLSRLNWSADEVILHLRRREDHA